MSEFTYACPACHQHIKCDSSKGGSVMECPTCFQKIVAPQAPGEGDSHLVFTGHRYVEKKNADLPTHAADQTVAPTVAGKNKLPLIIGLVLAGVLAAGAAVFFLKNRAGESGATATEPPPSNPPAQAVDSPNAKSKPEAPVPAASDAFWTYNLTGVTIPDIPVVGRIHGKDFKLHHAEFANGKLSFSGQRGPFVFGVAVDFNGASAESLAGKAIDITTDTKRAAKVTLLWREHGQQMTADFAGGYAMRLEFGPLRNNNKNVPFLSGSIYLCTSDNTKSYLMGAFKTIPPAKPK